MHNTYILYKTFCKERDKIKTQLNFRIAFMEFLIPSRNPVNKTTRKNRKTVNKESNVIKNSDLHLMKAYKTISTKDVNIVLLTVLGRPLFTFVITVEFHCVFVVL
ncbi:hypothetical protein CDIK_2248 [Cucumispora dikerogammari]|nr:hypothetical protein CDIK_2248 [Cucumispora dikerogammari]